MEKTQSWTSSRRATIVAEVGNNHEGSMSLAEELVGKAAEAGADAVKFQTFIPELFVSPEQTDRMERMKQFQLTFAEFESLSKTAKTEGIEFFSTPLDLESAKFLNSIQNVFKIASGDNNFWPLIDLVLSFDKPLIVSTGLATLKEVQKIHTRVQTQNRLENRELWFAMLHCVSAYPVPAADANLSAISTLVKEFPGTLIGYSDHTIGISAAKIARALGACIIEKHFTIDNNFSDFRDHQLSANPSTLKSMVEDIREIETMLGHGDVTSMNSENEHLEAIRRSVSAKVALEQGAVLGEDDIMWIRPGTGVQPGDEAAVLGKRINRSVPAGATLELQDFD